MKKYLTAYLNYIENLIKAGKISEEIIKKHLIQIQFMQHERLIHLIVTVLFAVLLFICIGILTVTESMAFMLLTLLILCLLIPYIMHYYFLENSVQKMYTQYNTMIADKETETEYILPEECRMQKSSENQ